MNGKVQAPDPVEEAERQADVEKILLDDMAIFSREREDGKPAEDDIYPDSNESQDEGWVDE